MTAIGLGLIVLTLWPALKGGGFETSIAFSMLISVCLRVCWIITVPIIFHRVNESWKVAQLNLAVIKDQSNFAATGLLCGDPYAVMNIDVANQYMLQASLDMDKAWKYTLAMILIMMTEILMACVLPCIGSCCQGSRGSANVYEAPIQEQNYKPADIQNEEELLIKQQ